MFRFIGRSFLCLLIVLQAVQPALACPCESIEVVSVESACGCETYSTIESQCGCEAMEVVVDSCEVCGEEVISCVECGSEVQTDEEESSEPQPAETKKTETDEPAPTPQPLLPPSTNETTSEDLGPAPINVPSEPAAGTATEPAAVAPTTTNELFPGPAATDQVTPPTSTPAETTPTTEPAPPSRINTEGLFDEPVAEPADSTSTEEAQPSTTTEELFVEPSQPAPTDSTESTEEAVTESTETKSEETTEETPTSNPPASNPLDELFSPSTPTTEPAPEAAPTDNTDTESESTDGEETEKPASDPFDPFSQNELPAELRLPGGLVSQDYRGWSDRANNFQVNARLVRMMAEGVFLADESGEYVAMSFAQLSDVDLSFVREQVRAQRVVLANQQSTLVARAAK
jgi:hypothetical protein